MSRAQTTAEKIDFDVRITEEMAAIIDPADPADPIARQLLPSAEELNVAPHERADPIGDERFSPLPGLVHRYPDRALLLLSHSCPVHCRFCFRRDRVGAEEPLSSDELGAALGYVRSHPEIWEVILSGGDPLMLPPARLGQVIRALDGIDHVEVIRIHSRAPLVHPRLVTRQLISALTTTTALYLVLHCNHPAELTAAAADSCARLRRAGIVLLSQTVLLQGVNDRPEILEQLLRSLVRHRIKPYYLHHPDLARGTSHFRGSIASGQQLLRSLWGRVSGLCQPHYVLDIPGGYGKVPIGPCYLEEQPGSAGYLVTDYQGATHSYPGPEPPDSYG